MKRTVFVTIAGKDYPMRFSLGASMAISKRFGSLKKMAEKLSLADQGGKDVDYEAMEAILWITETLIRQGCAYKNLFEKDIASYGNAPVENGRYIPLTADELEAGIDIRDLEDLVPKIFETIGGGSKREVYDEENEKKAGKNAETT